MDNGFGGREEVIINNGGGYGNNMVIVDDGCNYLLIGRWVPKKRMVLGFLYLCYPFRHYIQCRLLEHILIVCKSFILINSEDIYSNSKYHKVINKIIHLLPVNLHNLLICAIYCLFLLSSWVANS